MNVRSMLVWLLGVAFVSTLAVGQAGQLRGVAETYERNREALRRYSWTSRTEIVVDGELRETTRVRVRYDENGNLEESTVADTDDGTARSLKSKRRSRKKAKKASELSRALGELIRSYTRFTPGQIDTVFGRASVFPGQGDAAGTIRIETRNVVREGDTMLVWADSLDQRLRRVEIVTSLEGEPVEVATVFRDLPDGPTYPARTTVETEIKGKTTVMTIENFDYVRQDD